MLSVLRLNLKKKFKLIVIDTGAMKYTDTKFVQISFLCISMATVSYIITKLDLKHGFKGAAIFS